MENVESTTGDSPLSRNEVDSSTSNLNADSVQCNNISSSEVDEETQKKLRGDAIGDTLYSQSFVLKTLMQFSNVRWSDELDTDLCFLWDMTLEKDVCEFLFDVQFPTIACLAMNKCSEERFLEICVGILANMLCANCERTMNSNELKFVVDLISHNDPLILIQVMRFISAFSSAEDELTDIVDDDTVERLCFILESSTNEELLTKALEVVVKMTTDYKLDKRYIDDKFIKACFVGYRTLPTENRFEDKSALRSLVQIMCNLCGYMNNFEDPELSEAVKANENEFLDEVSGILHHYGNERHLFPLNDEFDFYMEAASFLTIILSAFYTSDVFVSVFKVINLMLRNNCPVIKSLVEVVTYLIFKGDVSNIKNDLKKFKTSDVKSVLDFIEAEKYDCEFQYQEKLHVLKTFYS